MRRRMLFAVTALSIMSVMTAYAGQWQKSGDRWSYIQDHGQPIKEGWFQDADGKVYNFNGGYARSGWYQENGKHYYFSPTSCERMTGKFDADGKTYFCGPQGVMQTGWFMMNGKWYHAKGDGSLDKGLTDINGSKFYFFADGHMAVNEWAEDGKYFATTSGEIATNQWVDGETYIGVGGKVVDADTTIKSSNKVKLQNKVYTDDEYMSMLADHVARYGDACNGLVEMINNYRMDYNNEHVYNYEGDDDEYYEKNELPELNEVDSLDRAATLRAMELASQQRASGARPNGREWNTVVKDVGGKDYTRLTESVAFGQSDAEDAYDDLEAGNGHITYWRDKKITEIGVGAASDVDGKMYWVIIYAE